jgi:hypothetical protein
MKKILIAAVGAVVLMTAQAQAGNDGGAIIGGVIGGLLLGEVLNNHHEHYPRYYEEDRYVQRCYTQYRQQWNEYYQQWERDPVTVCRWEHRY